MGKVQVPHDTIKHWMDMAESYANKADEFLAGPDDGMAVPQTYALLSIAYSRLIENAAGYDNWGQVEVLNGG